jgi:hypothetical protein
MNRSKLLNLTLSAVVLTSALFTISCSKESTPSGASGVSLLENQILTYLPNSSVGFFTWDTQSEGYKKMKASVFGKNMSRSYDMLKKFENESQSPEAKKFMRIVDGLVQTGLWAKAPTDPEAIQNGVIYFNIDTAKKLPEIGLYATATSGNDLQAKITTMEGIIAKEGLKTAKENLAGGSSPVNKVLVVATKDKLAIGTTPEIVSKFLSGTAEGGMQKIKDSNEFKQATKGMITSSENMYFAFLDFNKLTASLDAIATATGADTGANELKEIPVESFAMSSGMKDNLSGVISVSLNPKNDNQKKVITALSSGGKNDLVKRVPSDLMLLLSINGSTIANIKKAALEQVPAEILPPEVQSSINLLDSIKTLAIGLRGPQGATPFPELMVVAESSQAADIEKNVKSQLETAMASSGMPLPWQQKNIAGANVTYTMSPFGIGAYLASAGESVILSTGEKLVGDVLETSKNDSKGLLASLSQNSKDMVNNSNSMLVAYSDFSKIGNTLGSVQDSLAMFTGGRNSIPQDQIDNLKAMPTVIISLNLENNLVKLQSTYEAPTQPNS